MKVLELKEHDSKGKVLELLELKKFKAMREKDEREELKRQQESGVTLDSASETPTQKTHAGIEIGVPTKSQILGDLKKVARKKTPDAR